ALLPAELDAVHAPSGAADARGVPPQGRRRRDSARPECRGVRPHSDAGALERGDGSPRSATAEGGRTAAGGSGLGAGEWPETGRRGGGGKGDDSERGILRRRAEPARL